MADELTLEMLDKLIETIKPYEKPKCDICGKPADCLFTYFFVCEGCVRTGKAELVIVQN